MIENIYDVLIAGGGFCGFACAIKSAWNGKKVLLIEKRPALSWEGTWANQLNFNVGNSSVTNLIVDELNKVDGLKNGRADAPILEMLMDKLADKNGVSLLLYSYPVRLIFDDDLAYGIVIGNKSGEQIIKAKIVVDATEEALLWRQTNTKIRKDFSLPTGRQTIFFNHVEDDMKLPMKLGDDITIYPSVWEGEVCVEYNVEKCDPLLARRKMPEMIKLVRSEVPQLKDALLTHAGNEPFPDTAMVEFEDKSIEHPRIKNFFGAGIWSSDAENSPIGRLEIGEKVGQILSKCDGVKEFPTDIMTGSYFREPEKASDVIVIGGGTGGSISAIASGRQGVKTTLIEASPSLGGIGTGGAIHVYCAGTRGGIQDEMDNKIAEISPLFLGKWKVVGFHPEAKKTILQQMAEEAGVDIILNTVISGVIREKGKYQTKSDEKVTTKAVAIPEPYEEINRLLGVIAVGSNGVSIYRAKVFIDSTGDGDIAAMSGAPFVIGRERDNLTHTFSQPAEGLNKDGNLYGLNFDAGYVDPTDVEDLTRGRRLGINLYWHDKFTPENRILHIAPIIGIRQSRQIIGEYQLTLADEIAGRRFEDGISFMTTFYDNHGFDYENESDEAALWVWALGNFSRRIGCEIPYRCLIPKNVDGLILACRAISLTFDAHAGMRMQNDIQRIGEVAGLSASIAVKDGVPVREIDIKKLQAMLKESGILDEKYRPAPAVEDRPLELPTGAEIDESKTEALVWLSTYKGKETALALKNLISSEDPNMRFRASAALARYGVEEAFQELLRSVKNRVSEKTKGAKSVAIWEASIPFLGITGDKRAVPALVEVLKDKNATLDALIGALRALERIGDKSVISDIKEFLKRDDLPTKRVLQSSSALLKDMSPAVDDAKWQIELASAETLLSLGVPIDEVRQIVEPHLKDNRAYVRRYANKILSM